MRIVFMGTGDIAIPAFRSLVRNSDLVGLVTQPDRPVGRHQVLTAPAIKNIAREAGIPVLQPHSLRTPDALINLKRLNPDLIAVMAYGQILSQEVIDMAPMGCINAHASLLPRHRGAACIQSAIKSGDSETGITIMHIVKKLDAGDIIAQISTPLEGTETGGSLHDKLAQMTPDVLLPAIHAIEKGTATRVPQKEFLATYAPKLLRADGKIDWTRPAEEIGRMIRAYDPVARYLHQLLEPQEAYPQHENLPRLLHRSGGGRETGPGAFRRRTGAADRLRKRRPAGDERPA